MMPDEYPCCSQRPSHVCKGRMRLVAVIDGQVRYRCDKCDQTAHEPIEATRV